jgi:Mg/Co/Ni transporter MgtE
MSAAEIIQQIEHLPNADLTQIEEWLKRRRAVEAFDEMCRIGDEHSTLKHLSEEEITAICERKDTV